MLEVSGKGIDWAGVESSDERSSSEWDQLLDEFDGMMFDGNVRA